MTQAWLDAIFENPGESMCLALTGLLVRMVFGCFEQRSRFCLRSAVIEFARKHAGAKLA